MPGWFAALGVRANLLFHLWHPLRFARFSSRRRAGSGTSLAASVSSRGERPMLGAWMTPKKKKKEEEEEEEEDDDDDDDDEEEEERG